MSGPPPGPPPAPPPPPPPPSGPPQPPPPSSGPPQPPPPSSGPPPAVAAKRPIGLIIAIVVLLAGIGTGAVLLTKKSSKHDARPLASATPSYAERTFTSISGEWSFRYPETWFVAPDTETAWFVTSYDPGTVPPTDILSDGMDKLDFSITENAEHQTLTSLDVCRAFEQQTLVACSDRTVSTFPFKYAEFTDNFGGAPTIDLVLSGIAGDKIFRVAAYLPNGAQQATARRIVERIYASFEIAPAPTAASSAPQARGKYGTVAKGVAVDGLTIAMFEFMDARIARDAARAEESLTADTKKKFDANTGGLNLVSPTSNPHYASYEILSRESGDASLAGFVVRITEEAGGASSGVFREEIEIGPGTTGNGEDIATAVIDARRVPGCNGKYYDC